MHKRSEYKCPASQTEQLFFIDYGVALSRVFISFEAFRLTLIKKDRQNGEHRNGQVFIEGAKL